MHEFSISKEIAMKVKKVAQQKDADHVNKINLRIGKLSHLNVDQLEYCFKTIAKGDELLDKTKLNIEEKNIEVECSCGYEGQVGDEIKKLSSLANHLKCPSCGNLNPSIKKGKEIFVKDIKIVREDE
ncbi:hypothetical protein C9439_07685 [archaeon SCG-AAA382B04]|nr:hypothetical protein C9439_07685 [archaeon SCG-AAA382B04]